MIVEYDFSDLVPIAQTARTLTPISGNIKGLYKGLEELYLITSQATNNKLDGLAHFQSI
jgi:hypothetical protein